MPEATGQDGDMIHAVLFDLDGVVRHFDHDPDLERRHGLPEGSVTRAALAAPLLDDVTCGRITRAEWIRTVGEQLGSPEAAEEWGRTPFHIDPDLIELALELRALDVITAILTNGTDTIPQETASCDLDRHFHPIFNTAEIGFAKPDPRAFTHALDALQLPGDSVFFTDDSPSKLVGAREVEMHAHAFVGIGPLRAALRGAGVLVTNSN